ncbi:MAG TPA: ATP-binding protein [Actinomycetota bacterium]|nr:ATP-binding protein [Actinomycetota bacterium]
MTTVGQPMLPVRFAVSGDIGTSALRSERSIALIRIAVVGAVMWIYLGSIGIQRSLGPAALVILAMAGLYGVVSLLVLVAGQVPSWRARIVTLVLDILLITLWIQATGGASSEFWTLYLIVVVSAALRFRLVETLGISVGLTILHLALMLADEGLTRSDLVYRPTLMIATGFAVGLLAHQRALHRREHAALEALAEMRTRELGLERAEVERLKRLDLKRSEFVAIAAHEFRTPLAAVLGVLSTLKTHGNVLEESVRHELIDGARNQAERLSRLVEDLLTASRIEDGVLRLHLERVKPKTLLAHAAQASGTSERVDVDLRRVDPLFCDADALVRVLTNLLDNAAKYSPPEGRIRVSVSQTAETVRFAVADAGPGIPPDAREAAFERFRRLGDGAKPGAGLGLYISRGLVEAHGGTMAIGSAPEGGAEFTFEIPRGIDAALLEAERSFVTQITAASTAAG